MTKEYSLLIVDDDEEILSSFRRAFELEGWMVHTAKTLDDALFEFKSYQWDAALLDLVFPGVPGQILQDYPWAIDKEKVNPWGFGMSLLRIIRNLNPRVHIVVMTAYPNMKVAAECYLEGANGFFDKKYIRIR
jgi:DNA-binding NtrC family response regulator